MKIAFFTPLQPIKSGISNYSAELLPYLSRYFDIDIYIDNYKINNPSLYKNFTIKPYCEFPDQSGNYDMIIYQMGNYTEFHSYMYNALLQYPGIVVLHDLNYFHFYSGLTLSKNDESGFRSIMEYCYGEPGIHEAEMIMMGKGDHFKYAMNRKLIDSSIGVIVHSEHSMRKIVEDNCKVDVSVIQMGIEHSSADTDYRENLRQNYGYTEDQFLVMSLGMVSPHKRVEVAITAFAEFRKINSNSKYIIVGENSSEHSMYDLIVKLGLENDVIITGYVDELTFQDYISMADICITLRYPTAGETSAAMLRAMEAGKPVLVSNYAQFAGYPDNCTIKIDIGPYEKDLIVAYMKLLAEDNDLRKTIGENARRYIHEKHNLENTAKKYSEFIHECINKNNLNSVNHILAEEIKSAANELGGSGCHDLITKETEERLAEFGIDFNLRTQKETKLFRVNHESELSFKKRTNEKPAHYKCDEIFEETCILADGRVVCSCVDSTAQKVYGNVRDSAIKEIVNNFEFQRLRYSQIQNKLSEFCRECPLRNKKLTSKEKLYLSEIKTLQIEIINLCNLRCPECILSHQQRDNTDCFIMSFDYFKSIIDQLAGPLRLIKFFNYGEPFLHPDSMKMLEYIKKSDKKIQVVINTNGNLLDEDRQHQLVDLGIDMISFSVDGASQETYSKYRVNGDFNKVLSNMSGLISYRKLLHKNTPNVIWQYILFDWNDCDDEINLAKKLAVEAGVDALLFVLTHTKGASRRYVEGSAELKNLVSRKGIKKTYTQFILSTTASYKFKNGDTQQRSIDLVSIILAKMLNYSGRLWRWKA